MAECLRVNSLLQAFAMSVPDKGDTARPVNGWPLIHRVARSGVTALWRNNEGLAALSGPAGLRSPHILGWSSGCDGLHCLGPKDRDAVSVETRLSGVSSGLMRQETARAERIPMTAPAVLVTTSTWLENRSVINSSCPSSTHTDAAKPIPTRRHQGMAGRPMAAKVPSGMNITTFAEASTKW